MFRRKSIQDWRFPNCIGRDIDFRLWDTLVLMIPSWPFHGRWENVRVENGLAAPPEGDSRKLAGALFGGWMEWGQHFLFDQTGEGVAWGGSGPDQMNPRWGEHTSGVTKVVSRIRVL